MGERLYKFKGGKETFNYNNTLNDEIKKFVNDRDGINKEEKQILRYLIKAKRGILRNTSKDNLDILRENGIQFTIDSTKKIANRTLDNKGSFWDFLKGSNNSNNNSSEQTNINFEKISPKMLVNYAAMVLAEAGGEGIKGKIAVANVIKNRMKGGKISLKNVLFKRTKTGNSEFSPVDDGRLNKMRRRVKKSDIKLVKDVLAGILDNPVKNATFFQNKAIERTGRTWQQRAEKRGKLKKIATIGNHIFREVV